MNLRCPACGTQGELDQRQVFGRCHNSRCRVYAFYTDEGYSDDDTTAVV